MEHGITWGGEVEDVYIRTSGAASLEGLSAFTEEILGDDRWRSGMRVIVDHRDLDWTPMGASALRQRADFLMMQRDRGGSPRVAVVVARAADYGVQRVMQGVTDDWGEGSAMELAVFYTVGEAREWLRNSD